jgi:A/G-specific adenine glycosylase
MHEFTGFSDALIFWYDENKRNLPWRNTNDPYLIWVSEIILQQTRVVQGLDYYNKITSLYPTVADMANADSEDIMKNWQGLGYYSRARNMHTTAKYVVAHLKGKFPTEYSELIKLKGVGRYTAAAVSSISGNEMVPVIDGNVYRLISRYFGMFTDIASHRAYNEFFEIAKKLVPKENPGLFNQAMMELGAIICTPVNAKCNDCPVSKKCYANSKGIVDRLPVKAKKNKAKDRFFNYLVLRSDNNILVNKRQNNDIWKSLYDFPMIESPNSIDEICVRNHPEFLEFQIPNSIKANISGLHKHQLTHQTIYAIFFQFHLKALPEIEGLKQIKITELHDLAVPRLIDKFIQLEFADKK